MSNLLKIGKNGNFYLDGNLVVTSGVSDINEYMMQLLGFYITIEEGVTLDEVMHSIFGMKKFISGYFSEEYEVIRALTTSSKLDRSYKSIILNKSFKVETDDFMSDDEFLYVLPEVSFLESKGDEKGYKKLGDLPLIIDEKIKLNHNDIEINLRSKFTLLDVLTCIFDEIGFCIRTGTIATAL